MAPPVTAEYHVHLEGTLRPATLRKLAARHGITLSDRFAGDTVELADFDDFIACYLLGLEPLRTAEDFSDAVAAYTQELVDQGVTYVEMTTTAYAHHERGIPRSEYVEGLIDGRRRAASLGVDVRWIVDIPRNVESPELGYTADFVCGPDAPDGTIAIGLGGNELDTPAQLWMDSFDRARAAGLLVVLHAGETQGPESIWNALECRADRIGHGISCVRDDELVRRLVDEQIMLEVCPTSNVKTRVVRSYDEHPVHEMIARGLHVTINSDDPGYFGASLSEEVARVYTALT